MFNYSDQNYKDHIEAYNRKQNRAKYYMRQAFEFPDDCDWYANQAEQLFIEAKEHYKAALKMLPWYSLGY